MRSGEAAVAGVERSEQLTAAVAVGEEVPPLSFAMKHHLEMAGHGDRRATVEKVVAQMIGVYAAEEKVQPEEKAVLILHHSAVFSAEAAGLLPAAADYAVPVAS